MRGWFRRLFRAKRAGPALQAAFPPSPLDTASVAADLDLAKSGALRGQRNLPRADEARLDEHEQAIVDRVSEHRQEGLDAFSNHLRVYAGRAERASVIDTNIRDVASKAETNFQNHISSLAGDLENHRDHLKECEMEVDQFRLDNRLDRTAFQGGGLAQWAAISLIIVLVESALNGVFFANAHEMGIAGGVAIALGISVVNVGAASVFGLVIRNFNHIHLWRKFTGFIVFGLSVIFALSFNFFVANFRDAMTRPDANWDLAAGQAIDDIAAGRFPESIDAWLLAMLGLLATILAGWKAWGADDPYPGYGRVWRKRQDARDAFNDEFANANDTLTETRDEASRELREALGGAQRRMADAARAAQELASFPDRRSRFLDECDRQANALLAIYREANRRRRTSSPPERFDREFGFPPDTPPSIPEPPKAASPERLGAIVNHALERIHDSCRKGLSSFAAIRGPGGSSRLDDEAPR